MDLRSATNRAERDDLRDCRIAKVGHMWIVEGHVPLLSDSRTDPVDRAFRSRPAIAQRLRLQFGSRAVNVLEADGTIVCRIALI